MSSFITSQPHATIIVVAFSERVLGGDEAVDLANLLRGISSDVSTVVFDLAQVDMMNSSGLGMLVRSLTSLKAANKLLRLAAVPDRVMMLLTMTHLTMVFEIHPTVEAAVALQ